MIAYLLPKINECDNSNLNQTTLHTKLLEPTMNFFFITIVLLSALIFFLNNSFDVLTFKDNALQMFYVLLLILFVSSAVSSGKIRQNLKFLSIWAGIFLIMITGYSYRHELSNMKDTIVSEVLPSKGLQKTPNAISFRASSDGHFYIRARVSGIPVMFLADTGASHIVLSPNDALKLGIKTHSLTYNRLYETANGTVRGSMIRMKDLKIGNIHFKDIGASVNQADMRHSLLGMTFFRRLDSYEVKNDVLTLYWGK